MRVCLLASDGTLLAHRQRANRPRPAPPYLHADVDGLFAWMCEALAELTALAEVEALVPVAHGATAALLGDDGLVLPVLDYEVDLPPLQLRPGDERETLSPRLPAGLNLATQLAWQQATFPEPFARARQLLLHPQYWAWRFGGRAVAEVTSLGCHTLLWAPATGRPSSLARRRGWDGLLPPLVPAWECVGHPSREAIERAGLPSGCRLLAGVHDSNASYLVHRVARREPFAVVSSGTWVVVLAHGADLGRLRPERDMLASVDALGEPVPTMRFAGGREYAALAGAPGLAAGPRPAHVQAVLDEGLVALPAFADEGGPFAGRAGRVLPGLPHDPVLRAALASLYAALMIDLCLDDLGAGGDVIVEGAMASNAALLGTLAALRPGQAVLASRDATGTTRGAALLARWGRPAPGPELFRAAPASLDGLAEHREAWRAQAR